VNPLLFVISWYILGALYCSSLCRLDCFPCLVQAVKTWCTVGILWNQPALPLNSVRPHNCVEDWAYSYNSGPFLIVFFDHYVNNTCIQLCSLPFCWHCGFFSFVIDLCRFSVYKLWDFVVHFIDFLGKTQNPCIAESVFWMVYNVVLFQDDKFSHFSLERCSNPNCTVSPVQYLASVQNTLMLVTQKFIHRYYEVSISPF